MTTEGYAEAVSGLQPPDVDAGHVGVLIFFGIYFLACLVFGVIHLIAIRGNMINRKTMGISKGERLQQQPIESSK